MRFKLLTAVAALLALMCACACAEERLNIVCTDFPCFDFARQVAGDRADVAMLLKPGVEPHAFEPTPADILSIGEADLFVYIGGESDAWADGILSGFDGADAPAILRMMACVSDPVEEAGHDHDDGPEYDEHIWTAPENAARMVRAVADALAALDGAHAQYYADNADAYCAQIDEIDAQIREIVEGAARRELVFADRFPFAYFTRAYGLDHLAAFSSCTADTEPSAQIVMALIQKVVEDRIPAVYTIEMSTQAIARTVAEETGAQILTLHSMQTVTQKEYEDGASWVSIMRDNVEALRKGLN